MTVDTGEQVFFQGHTAPISAMALSANDSLLATAQRGSHPGMRIWDFASGECLALL